MEEKYAYIEKNGGERIDLSNYYCKYPHQDNLSIPSIKRRGYFKNQCRANILARA